MKAGLTKQIAKAFGNQFRLMAIPSAHKKQCVFHKLSCPVSISIRDRITFVCHFVNNNSQVRLLPDVLYAKGGGGL
jgi:hypothetical protein